MHHSWPINTDNAIRAQLAAIQSDCGEAVGAWSLIVTSVLGNSFRQVGMAIVAPQAVQARYVSMGLLGADLAFAGTFMSKESAFAHVASQFGALIAHTFPADPNRLSTPDTPVELCLFGNPPGSTVCLYTLFPKTGKWSCLQIADPWHGRPQPRLEIARLDRKSRVDLLHKRPDKHPNRLLLRFGMWLRHKFLRTDT